MNAIIHTAIFNDSYLIEMNHTNHPLFMLIIHVFENLIDYYQALLLQQLVDCRHQYK